MSFRVDRRDFFRFATGGAAGVASGVTLRGISRMNEALDVEEVRIPGGPEAFALSVCSLCPAGCGLRVRTIGGRAVSIRGNPQHPVNHGRLCPRGLAGLQALYHPDRLRAPLKNTGNRSAPRWREVSWKEAIATVAGKLGELREAGQAHTVAAIDRRENGLLTRLLGRFLAAYGSPNHLSMPSGLNAVQAAVYLQQGVRRPVAYDLEGARYVLSFGANLLEGWGAPAAVMRAFGRWRDTASGRRTKFVQIEPRLSPTAARADEWVAIRPGTEAALALGIAYVLITEGLYDAAFVRDHTFGFDDWSDDAGRTRLGLRSLVLGEYRLNDVATLTGVPAETILRVAREFGQNRPAIALGDPQTSTWAGNPYAAMAVHSLNALSGSIDVPGGVLIQAELPAPEPAVAPRRPRFDEASEYPFPGHHVSRLAQAIGSGKPYPLRALLLREVNPVFALPNGNELARALQSVPFIVALTPFLDESAALADLVLPTPVDLERWQEAGSPPAFPYAVQSVCPPVVAPRQNVRHPGDILLELGRQLGGPVAAALPWSGFEEYLRSQANELFAAQTGSVFSSSLEETWNRLLERSGWWSPTYSNPEELWEQMQRTGGWWEPAYPHGAWERVFRTPSHRFEFFSQTLAGWASREPEFCRRAGLEPGDDRLALPHQPAPKAAPPGYPLLLVPVETLPLAGGEGAHLPYLEQIAGAHLFESWDSWLEIHPETAHKLGIRDGQEVWVESRRGRARVRARLFEGVRPDVVHLPLGFGHTQGSLWARRGANPLALLEERYEPVAGLPEINSTYVKVYRG